MMKAVGLEPNLIRLASENNIAGKKPFRFTGRMKAYSGVMVVLLGVLVYLLGSRTDVGISILRTPGQLYQQQPNGQLSNLYNYKLLNKTYKDKELNFKPENFNGTIRIVGDEKLLVHKENDLSGSMFIFLDENSIHQRKTQLRIGVYEGRKKIKTIATSFVGPFNNN